MRPLEPLRRTVDYCAYRTQRSDGSWHSYPFQKPTSIWSNVDGWQPRRCTCEGRRHASSLVGDAAQGKRGDFRGGAKCSLAEKLCVPTELQIDLLSAARRSRPDVHRSKEAEPLAGRGCHANCGCWCCRGCCGYCEHDTTN